MVGINTLKNISRFHKYFKNWKFAIFAFYFKKFPIEVVYRDNFKIPVKCLSHLWMASYGFKFSYCNNDLIVFDFDGKQLKFNGTENNGAIGDVFVEKELEMLDVKGKVVIDIGANIGDSPVYFVLKGAERVIAIEPFPYTYELLKNNISTNGVSEKVTALNVAIGGKTGMINVSPFLTNTVGTLATDTHDGVQIKILTVNDLLEDLNLNLNDIILKMDCEGCEYEVLPTISKSNFNKINEIFIEYHNGLKYLKDILNQNGFITTVKSKGRKMGLLIGKRQ